MPKSPRTFKAKTYKDPQLALDAVTEIYESNLAYLQAQFKSFAEDKITDEHDRVSACYPYIKIVTKQARRVDTRLAYGFAPRPGTYSTTLTRP
jgi:AMP nucleosidase